MVSSRYRRLAVLALALVALPAAAQTAPPMLTPGSPDLVEVAPQSFSYEVRIAAEIPRTIGRVTHTETRDGDRLVAITHASVPMGGQNQRDTTVVVWPSLAPVSRAVDDGEEASRVAFADGRVRGRLVLGNLDEALDAPLPEGVFAEGTGALLVRALPFEHGYTATLRVVDKRGDVTTDTVEVSGPEPFTHPDGSETTAWMVSLASPGDPTTTYWVDTETREILKMSFPAGRGMTIETGAPAVRPDGPILRPGAAALVTDWLADDEAIYTIRVVEPMQMDAGTMTARRTVSRDEVTVEQTVSVPMQNMEVTSVSRAEAGTLAPLAFESDGGPETTRLAFTPQGVAGMKMPASGEGERLGVVFEAPVFDGSMAAEIAQSLPLEEGYTTVVEAYDTQQGVYAITYRVTGQEEIDGGSTWVVEAVSPSGPTTYYVDPDTRRLLRIRMSPQPGVTVEMTRQ